MTIRRAAPADIDAMAALLAELFEIEDDFMIDSEKQKRGLSLLLEDAEAVVLVAEVGGSVAGMISMQRLVSTAEGGFVGLIGGVVVASPFRRAGVGTHLLESLIAQAQNQGMKRLALGVDQRNPKAIAFYAKYGFVAGNMGLMYRS